jgi:disulfide bond formation protein DsbB
MSTGKEFRLRVQMADSSLLGWIDRFPQRVMWLLFATCMALLAFGLYLQEVVGLVPCPMCIVQRYALILIAISAALTGATRRNSLYITGSVVTAVLAVAGAAVAARQSWLQWYPPEVASCGRDFYGMIETFPLQRALPLIFKGSGDCTKIDWTFLGGSIANWSFVSFCAIAVVALFTAWRQLRK